MRRFLAATTLALSLGCASNAPTTPFHSGTARMSEAEGIAYLKHRATTHPTEDLLAYAPQQGFWHDIGTRHGPTEVWPMAPVLAALCAQDPNLHVLHTHLFVANIFQRGGPRYGDVDLDRAKELDYHITGFPSVSDIMSTYTTQYACLQSRRDSRLEHAVVSEWQGGARVVRWRLDDAKIAQFHTMIDDRGVIDMHIASIKEMERDTMRYENIVSDGVFAGRSFAEILRQASDETSLTFWETTSEPSSQPRQ